MQNFKNKIIGSLRRLDEFYNKEKLNYEINSLKRTLKIRPENGGLYYNKEHKEKFLKIINCDGVGKVELYKIALIIDCLLVNSEEIFSDKYPLDIQEQFKKNIQRICRVCADEAGYSQSKQDDYWKDLAISRQEMFPAGAQVVERFSGIGLRQGFGVNFIQNTRFFALLIRLGGRSCYYQIHTHAQELEEFHEEGWKNCYLRIAKMMKLNPKVKGVVGTSWFFDPQLMRISPNLVYLRNIPIYHGAESFFVEKDYSRNALVKSKTRKKLYDEKKYTPKSYMIVWPKTDLLRWANL